MRTDGDAKPRRKSEMEWSQKKSTLKQTYYRSSLLLIVIPLILVFVGAEVTIGYYYFRIKNSEIINPFD